MRSIFSVKGARKSSNTELKEKHAFVDPSEACYPKNEGAFPRLSDIKLVYQGRPNSFSIAVGDWEDQDAGLPKQQMLLMRWNGNGAKNIAGNRGYPLSGTEHPAWFPIPHLFAATIIERLRDFLVEEKQVEDVLREHGFEQLTKICLEEEN